MTTIKTKPDYDSPWKEALENYFPDFMLLLFPKVHAQIDWNQPLEFLNTELQKIISSADSSRNYADKLVKVVTHEGEENWVLIHIEIVSFPTSTLGTPTFKLCLMINQAELEDRHYQAGAW